MGDAAAAAAWARLGAVGVSASRCFFRLGVMAHTWDTPALGRLKQEDLNEYEVILVYVVRYY